MIILLKKRCGAICRWLAKRWFVKKYNKLLQIPIDTFSDITSEAIQVKNHKFTEAEETDLLIKQYEIFSITANDFIKARWIQHSFFCGILVAIDSVLILRETGAYEGFVLAVVSSVIAGLWFRVCRSKIILDTLHMQILSSIERRLLVAPWTIFIDQIKRKKLHTVHRFELLLIFFLTCISIILIGIYICKINGIDISGVPYNR